MLRFPSLDKNKLKMNVCDNDIAQWHCSMAYLRIQAVELDNQNDIQNTNKK